MRVLSREIIQIRSLAAFMDALTIYALVVALALLFVNPFV
jgi:F0F1-type ATP synthase membrane subunit c/vacuolar-type H+-ATPase subunit K